MHPVLEDILEDIERLEPFPEVASRILELSLQPEVEANEIIEVIRLDAGITAKVIRLANSVIFGARVPITSIEHAGRHVGPRVLKSLIMVSTTCSYYMGLGASTLRSNRSLWEESVTCALAARLLAVREGHPDPDLAFTIGLLQNSGHIVMDRFLVEEREAILDRVAEGLTMLKAESEVLGLDHSQVAARIARKWRLPAILVDTILHHHDPQRARLDEHLCAIGNLAETLTWSLLGREGIQAPAYGVSGRTIEVLSRLPRDLAEFQEELEEAIDINEDLLGIASEPSA